MIRSATGSTNFEDRWSRRRDGNSVRATTARALTLSVAETIETVIFKLAATFGGGGHPPDFPSAIDAGRRSRASLSARGQVGSAADGPAVLRRRDWRRGSMRWAPPLDPLAGFYRAAAPRCAETLAFWPPCCSRDQCSPFVPSRGSSRQGACASDGRWDRIPACNGATSGSIRPASAWEFWCGRRGGVSHRRAWKAPADALCVAPAPRGRSRPRAARAFGALRCSARMVEVPNPAKFLG